MNERIKSLLVECGAELVKGTHNGRTGTAVNLPVGRMFDFEKFAELIVKECLSKVDKAGSNFNEQPQYNDKQNALVSEGFFWALESVKQQVKEHFGVSE